MPILSCIAVDHDLRLVVVAALICAIAAGAAFGFHARSAASRGGLRAVWIALTGLVAGSGVWATHFIAMLAYQPRLPIGYDLAPTALSLLVAVLGMGVGFALPLVLRERAAAPAGGGVAGMAIAAMHFIGIAAVRTQAVLEWNYAYVALALVIAVAGGATALAVHSRLCGWSRRLVPATLLLLAICGLHFTAMTAVALQPDPSLPLPTDLIDRPTLAAITATLAALILAAAVSLTGIERLGRRSTLMSLRQALDVTSQGLAFWDAKRRLVAHNQAYGRFMTAFGCPVEPGCNRDAVFAQVTAVIHDVQPYQADALAQTDAAAVQSAEFRSADERWFRYEFFETHDSGGVTVLTDVTAEKETARSLRLARDAADTANRAKTEFLANMSHEIRTPLNGVLGVADVLSRTPLDESQRDLVGVIQKCGTLLNSLLADLLDLAKVEAGTAELRCEAARLDQVGRGVAELLAPAAEEKGLTLRLELDDQLGVTMCDPLRLRQVLGNLASNAIKFTDAGEVVISLRRRAEQVRFEVRDTGPGVGPEVRATLFERFAQADGTATRRYGGAGLGLAICDKYVRLMGGTLGCESEPGKGAVFGFELRLPSVAAEAPPEPEVEFGPAEGATFRVLIVDDNAVNRQVLELILGSAGIDHVAVEDGKQAVEAYAAMPVDAVLMDIQMPVMDGLEATRRIRELEVQAARPRAPIYIVSANCLTEHVDAGRAAGADGHLNKPVSAAQILTALQPHLEAALQAA